MTAVAPSAFDSGAFSGGAFAGNDTHFSPLDIAGLELWLDGSDASTMYDATSGGSLVADGGAVARWEDKSGNGNHVTQSTANNRPLRTGVEGLDFDGADDRMLFTSAINVAAITVFAIYQRTGAGTRTALLASQSGANPQFMVNQYVADNVGYWNADGAEAAAAGGDLTIRSMIAWIKSGNAINVEVNTVNVAGNTGQGSASIVFDGIITAAGGHTTDCLLSELVIYDSALAGDSKTAVETYLLDKWGITP